MLKVKVEGGARLLEVSGSTKDVIVETAAVINGIYFSILEHDRKTAETFRRAMTVLVLDPNSPLWKDQTDGVSIRFGGVFDRPHE